MAKNGPIFNKHDIIRLIGAILFVAGGFHIPGVVNSMYEIGTLGLKFTTNSIQMLGVAIVAAPFAMKYFAAKKAAKTP